MLLEGFWVPLRRSLAFPWDILEQNSADSGLDPKAGVNIRRLGFRSKDKGLYPKARVKILRLGLRS